MFTPEKITSLQPNEVFVFGSDSIGQHTGGAAKVAFKKFGAKMGQAEGLQGQSYGIPTMVNYRKKFASLDEIKPFIDRFISFAKQNPQLTFFVTKIGCGRAGYTPSVLAPWFKECQGLSNVVMPKEFYESF